MTLLIVSDSHGRSERLARLFELHKNADALIFLGDGLSDISRAGVESYGFTVFSVRGNCDGLGGSMLSLRAKDELFFNFEGFSFLAMHGHTKGVKGSLASAVSEADKRGADVLLFGHTHEPRLTYLPEGEYNLSKPLYLFNPGSLASYSYGLCEIRGGQILFSHGEIY